MKFIQLDKNKKIIVDDADFDFLNQWKWFFHSEGYAVRDKMENYRKKSILMHRFIMNPSKGLIVDHINGNRLDNRKENLRLCTHRQNQMNRIKRKIGQSNYKGVTWSNEKKKWLTRVDKMFIGYFKTEHQAALAYDINAKAIFGEFSQLNFGKD